MKIDVQAPFSVSEPMQELIEEKVGKLQLFLKTMSSAFIIKKAEKLKLS